MAVVVHRTMSLDGYVAGPGHAMKWVFELPAPEMGAEVMHATGAVLAGRASYGVNEKDAGSTGSNAPYGGQWSGPIFVLSHAEPPPLAGLDVRWLNGDIGEAVATAKDAAGGRNVEVFGSDVGRQCFERGLVDEIVVHVAPLLLGGGVPFLATPEGLRVDLELIDLARTDGMLSLRYRVG